MYPARALIISCLSLTFLLPATHSAATASPACHTCLRSPPFPGGRILYVPHCVEGRTVSACDAVCAGQQISSKTAGSCDKCEQKCGQVWAAVCSQDQMVIFSNPCQAKCSGEKAKFNDCLVYSVYYLVLGQEHTHSTSVHMNTSVLRHSMCVFIVKMLKQQQVFIAYLISYFQQQSFTIYFKYESTIKRMLIYVI